MANCLVTGGSGFIGSHIVDRLIDMGHYVINIDNESAESNREFYKNLSADNYKLDVTNYKSIEPLFHGVDYVFHLALVLKQVEYRSLVYDTWDPLSFYQNCQLTQTSYG